MVLTHLQHWHFVAVVFNILFYLDIFSFFAPLRIGLFIKILTALFAGLHADLVYLRIVAVSLVSVAVTWILVHAAWRGENTSIGTKHSVLDDQEHVRISGSGKKENESDT